MNYRSWSMAGLAAAFVICLDQVTKTLAVNNLQDGSKHVLGPLDFTLTYNSGVAFGLAKGWAPFLVVLALCIVVFVLVKTHAILDVWALIACGLVVGGAAGNMADRVFRARGGAVIDFIDIGRWPVFNIADSAVVVGAFALAILGSRKPDFNATGESDFKK